MKTALPSLIILTVITLASCSSRESTSIADTTVVSMPASGADIQGDFDGDGNAETATVSVTQEGEIMSTPWIYTITFSNPNIPALAFEDETETWSLINKGPLNAMKGDELIIFTQGSSMGIAFLQLYSLSEGMWGKAADRMITAALMPDTLTREKLIFKEKNRVMYYEFIDESEEDVPSRVSGFYPKEVSLYLSIEPVNPPLLQADIAAEGDFNGDQNLEVATVVTLSEGDAEDIPGTYRIEFSDNKIKPIEVSSARGAVDVISEGDLDGKPGSELSVITSTNMMNQNFISTYTYADGKWKVVLDAIQTRDILPEGLTRGDLIFEENGIIYYYDDESVGVFADSGNKADLKKIRIN